jgi:hypothetical protein
MGDITVSGGGSTAVATDHLLQNARVLATLADAASQWQQDLGSTAVRVGPYILRAQHSVREVHALCAELRDGLDRAAEAYGWAERTAASAVEAGGALAGYSLGVATPLIGWMVLGALPELAFAFGVASLITGSPAKTMAGATRWLSAHAGVLRNPTVVSFVRQAVSASDDVMLGAAGVPFPVARALDDRATGLFGTHGAVATVVALAGPSALKETPVTVTRAAATHAAPPVGFSDLAARVPANAANGPQVRIERYDVGEDRPHWVVYVAGTVDAGFVPASEPWDDTSNLQGVANLDPGSVRATREALRAAGARPGDAVLPVGYSQGGLAATSLATGTDYQTPELVTFGSPTGQIDVPSTVTDVAVEHRDDIIPALGGNPRPAEGDGGDRILVRRTTYDTPPPIDESPLAAHHLSTYAVTAAQMDASSDPRLVGARNTLATFTAGVRADVTLWRGDRVSAAG